MRIFLTKFPHISAYIALVSATIRHSFAGKACLLIGITAVLYGLLINNLNLWTDEIYSVLMAKDSLGDMFHLLLTEDSKPPLYYLYLKGILALFPNEYEIWGAHFASYILLLAAQLFAVTEVRKDYGDRTALWLTALMLLMPQSLWLAFEVRTYMLSAFLMLAALVYGLRVSEQPELRDYFKLGAATVLALYSHYYCALWLMFLYLFLLADILRARRFEQLKPFLATAGAAALLFAPWLAVPLSTGGEISRNWYVTMDFVRVSAQFFTTPPAAEIWQSPFFYCHNPCRNIPDFYRHMRCDGHSRRQNDKTRFKQQIAYYSGRNGAGDISAAYPAVRYGASDGYNPLHVYFFIDMVCRRCGGAGKKLLFAQRFHYYRIAWFCRHLQ